ncbi:hypothetical protein LXL04_035684 [Taraxacum kok-saghyz]
MFAALCRDLPAFSAVPIVSCSVAVWGMFCPDSLVAVDIPTNFLSLVEAVKVHKNRKMRKLAWALNYVVLWMIWKDRNSVVFKKRRANPMPTADEIQLVAFNWIKFRANCKQTWLACLKMVIIYKLERYEYPKKCRVEIRGNSCNRTI